MLRKPSPVGDQVAIAFSITQHAAFGFVRLHHASTQIDEVLAQIYTGITNCQAYAGAFVD
jgi:hypothetical protein